MAKKKEKFNSQTDNQKIEDYLSMKYQFRFNEIKSYTEYIDIEKSEEKAEWQPVSEYTCNSFWREMDCAGIETSPANIWKILTSNFCDKINPIKDYFAKLQKWDGKDHIATLTNTVTVVNTDKWNAYFTKWIVGVVANVLIDSYCANHLCLVLTGGQGKFKTTWLDNLCPKSLSLHYHFTGKIDPSGKDVLTYIAEYLFINIDDQLRQLNKTDENQLKNLITTPSVKYRRPYARAIEYYPHTASFMASVNGNDFLTDPTGNRRFLPFEVVNIDIAAAQKIDMDKIYSQALHLFKEKFSYWFNDAEVSELHENNQRFQVTSQEEELLMEYFTPAASRSEATDFLTRSMIATHIEMITKKKLSEKKLSEALVKLKFHKWQKTEAGTPKWVWSVIKKDHTEVDKQNKNILPEGAGNYDQYNIDTLNEMKAAAITANDFLKAADIQKAIKYKANNIEQIEAKF